MQLAGSALLAALRTIIFVLTNALIVQAEVLADTQSFPPNFNFHNKDRFLKGNVWKLVSCVNSSLPGSPNRLTEEQALKKSKEESPDGSERFIFKYIGTRGYKESCLGDAYKNDLLYRIYDGFCTTYEDKIKYLDSFSCNAKQHLECRQVGNEPERKFAEQSTPIMQCLCPDFRRTQAYLDDKKTGYFDKKRKMCVLKVGQICKPIIRGIDKRWKWRDIDYNASSAPSPPLPADVEGGIDVVDLRPTPVIQACVKNAFCFVNDSQGLKVSEIYRNRCVCKSGYFPRRDGECRKGTEAPSYKGMILATVLFVFAVATFLGGTIKN